MTEQFSRTELLIGEKGVQRLQQMRVAVFGVGGVGGYVCEALIRSGVGAFDLIDNDIVCLSNLNRQIIATHDTVGRYKVDVMKERMLSINPQADVRVDRQFFLPENAGEFPFEQYDYIVDAVDTVTAKLELIEQAKKRDIPVISAMGAGNKLDGSRFRVSDISKTSVCPLAKVMRRELKKRGIKSLKVVWSDEPPIKRTDTTECNDSDQTNRGTENADTQTTAYGNRKRAIPGSIAGVPAISGLIIAGEIIKDLTKETDIP